MKASRNLVLRIDQQVEPLAISANETLEHARKLLSNVDQQVEPLASRVTDAIVAADAALEQTKTTLDTIEKTAGTDSEVIYNLTLALEEISSAARSIHLLADYLGRHPESLLRGKREK